VTVTWRWIDHTNNLFFNWRC